MNLQTATQHVSDCMDEILSNFKEGAKITVLVRFDGLPDADFCMTSDDLDQVISMIERRKSNAPAPQKIVMGGLGLIASERARQIAKGYDASHDDEHKGGEIIMADWGARARIEAAINAGRSGDSPAYKELLAEAAAQCVAEIDRVERAEGKANA